MNSYISTIPPVALVYIYIYILYNCNQMPISVYMYFHFPRRVNWVVEMSPFFGCDGLLRKWKAHNVMAHRSTHTKDTKPYLSYCWVCWTCFTCLAKLPGLSLMKRSHWVAKLTYFHENLTDQETLATPVLLEPSSVPSISWSWHCLHGGYVGPTCFPSRNTLHPSDFEAKAPA